MIELINSSGSKIRGARIQVGAIGSILQRPVQALYPLEISLSRIDSPNVQERISVSTEDNTMIKRRDCPQRAAAATSQQIWRALETNND